MNVNKKTLAEIFEVDARTIERWQTQGMPVSSGGGKGVEVTFDSSAVIKWYVERDCELENARLRQEVNELRKASESDLQPGSIDYERYRLTRAQADAQELKNLKDEKLVVDTAFCTFALSRLANDIASVLDTIPLSMQRRFIEMDEIQLNYLKALIAKAMNAAVMTSEKIPEALDEYLSSTD
ncbi:terminase small subunit [Enterobacter sp. JMULE2]|uniref:terminase small subunit n=1 Tax=Enterobacter sp. JMULE2 TaxID=2518340 RepID=UPI0015761906|nr:terminase small subunit [Enterobacter sp. JMULE2]NTZ39996.1 terminase small subunit [Enterobacter sp. JMULE2]